MMITKKITVSINDKRHEVFLGSYSFYGKNDIEIENDIKLFVEDLRDGFVDSEQEIRFYNKYNKLIKVA